MKLVSAILTRNEAAPDRFLRRVLENALSFADEVIVLDDLSTDETPDIARSIGCSVRSRRGDSKLAWGNESSARQELWEWGAERAGDGWLLIQDADMELRGDVRALCNSTEVNAWCFVLYDLWSETEYREDQYWQGHLNYRPWLFAPNRIPFKAEWPDRGLHVGHFPPSMPLIAAFAPLNSHFWLHWAYSSVKLRREKHQQYLSKAELLTPAEVQHARSIIDLDPAPA